MAILNDIIYNKKDPGLCIYEWDGAIIVRRKSSLTRKMVLKSKEFKKTRDYAGKMAIASRLGSEIYRQLPKLNKNRSLYQQITGMAASLLYSGMEENLVEKKLREKFIGK